MRVSDSGLSRVLLFFGLMLALSGLYYIQDPILLALVPLGLLIMLSGVLLDYRSRMDSQRERLAELDESGGVGIGGWRLVDLEDRVKDLEESGRGSRF